MTINVQIGRIVLDGFSVEPGQQRRLREALATELTRRIAADGLSSELLSGRAPETVKAGTIELTNDKDPKRLGRQIAAGLYDGIGNREDFSRTPQSTL